MMGESKMRSRRKKSGQEGKLYCIPPLSSSSENSNKSNSIPQVLLEEKQKQHIHLLHPTSPKTSFSLFPSTYSITSN
jgi:hypothetical protein